METCRGVEVTQLKEINSGLSFWWPSLILPHEWDDLGILSSWLACVVVAALISCGDQRGTYIMHQSASPSLEFMSSWLNSFFFFNRCWTLHIFIFVFYRRWHIIEAAIKNRWIIYSVLVWNHPFPSKNIFASFMMNRIWCCRVPRITAKWKTQPQKSVNVPELIRERTRHNNNNKSVDCALCELCAAFVSTLTWLES